MKLSSKNNQWLSEAENIHEGERCFVIGNGPSLNRCDLGLLREEVSFGVNGIFFHPHFIPTYYATISIFFWEDHLERIRNVRCTRRFLPTDLRQLDSEVATSWFNFQRPRYYLDDGTPQPVPARFSTRPDQVIYGGGTVLFACMQLAYYMGFHEVVLLGVDHNYGQKEDEVVHGGYKVLASDIVDWHFDDKYFSPNANVHIDILAMERAYELAKRAFERAGRRIVNATQGSKLDIYPKADYHSLFQGGVLK